MNKPTKVLDFAASSGNNCELWYSGTRGLLAPVEVRWDHYPPSERDITEVNPVIAEYFANIGVPLRSKGIQVVTTEEHESVIERVLNSINAENN